MRLEHTDELLKSHIWMTRSDVKDKAVHRYFKQRMRLIAPLGCIT